MMPASVPTAMASAVTFYVALLHLWLHLKRRNPVDLPFALTAGFMAAYAAAAAMLELPLSAQRATDWHRLQFFAFGGMCIFFLCVLLAHDQAPRQRPLRAGILVLATLTVLGGFLPEALEPLLALLEVLSVVLLLGGAWGGRQRDAGNSGRPAPLATAAVLFAGVILHDGVVRSGLLHSYLLLPYASLAVVALAQARLSSEVIEAAAVRQTLARTEHHIATTLSAIQDAVITTDLGGTIAHLNPSAERLLAVRLDDVLGAPLSHYMEVTAPDALRPVSDPVRFAVGRPSNPFGDLPQLVTTDGSERRVDIGGAPLKSEDGHVQGAVVVVRDLTVQHHAIESLQHAKKMESTGRLAGGVAHDLNNLLTPIVSYVELLSRRATPGSDEALFLGYIQDAAERAAAVTRQLLALSRKQVLDVQVVAFAEFVRKREPLVRQIAGEAVKVELAVSEDAGFVKIDPGQIEQVILNLTTNARDAMPNGGLLTISVKRLPGGQVSLEVTDTGTGIDAETATRIFEPFFTTKPRGKGTGLGLASVRGIVEQHGGTIYVDSEPNEGTSFEILLPGAVAEGAGPSSHATPKAALVGGSEHVLVVEDDRSVRTLIHDALSELGYTVHTADGLAVAEAIASSEHLDLLITDVVMPGADGPRVYAAIRLHREIPCIYITGHADDRLGERGFVKKGTEVLQKPFSVTQLAERVRLVLDFARRKPAAPTKS